MKKSELVSTLADAAGMTQKNVSKVLDAFTSTVGNTLKKGDQVILIGFGTFKVSERKARTGRNPKTGAPLEIKASKIPILKAGKGLKEAVA